MVLLHLVLYLHSVYCLSWVIIQLILVNNSTSKHNNALMFIDLFIWFFQALYYNEFILHRSCYFVIFCRWKYTMGTLAVWILCNLACLVLTKGKLVLIVVSCCLSWLLLFLFFFGYCYCSLQFLIVIFKCMYWYFITF